MKNYEQQVEDFNKAANTSYIASIRFLKFRKTSKGIKVGFTLGKPNEINNLRRDVANAGNPYYATF